MCFRKEEKDGVVKVAMIPTGEALPLSLSLCPMKQMQ